MNRSFGPHFVLWRLQRVETVSGLIHIRHFESELSRLYKTSVIWVSRPPVSPIHPQLILYIYRIATSTPFVLLLAMSSYTPVSSSLSVIRRMPDPNFQPQNRRNAVDYGVPTTQSLLATIMPRRGAVDYGRPSRPIANGRPLSDASNRAAQPTSGQNPTQTN